MDEDVIAAKQRENIPRQLEPTPVQDGAPVQPGLPSDYIGAVELDEMTQYKFHEFFGERYRTSDEESKQRLTYIYNTVAELIGTSDYGYVVERVRSLEQMLGNANSNNRLYRLYQWLRLDGARRKIDAEMNSL